MPARETLRIDLKMAIDNHDGTISPRAYPLYLTPRLDANYDAFMIDRIDISPSTAILEIQFQRSSGHIDIFTTYGGGKGLLNQLVEHEGITLWLYNLSPDAGATVTLTVVQFRYDEPRG